MLDTLESRPSPSLEALLSFPSFKLSDNAWDSTLSRRYPRSELDEKRSRGLLVLHALLEQSLRRSTASLTDLEYLREVLLSDDVFAFLLSKAGVYDLATGKTTEAARAFLAFVDMAVDSSGGIREFEQWFKSVFDPLVFAISQTPRACQEPRGNKRSALQCDFLPSKRRCTEKPSLPTPGATRAILERLRQRQNLCAPDISEIHIALHQSRHDATPLSAEQDITLISFDSFSTCPSFSRFISADDNWAEERICVPETPTSSTLTNSLSLTVAATPHSPSQRFCVPETHTIEMHTSSTLTDSPSATLLPVASTPHSPSQTSSVADDPFRASDGPRTPPVTEQHLLEAAEQFIRETIEMVRRGELVPTPVPQPGQGQKKRNRKKRKADSTDASQNACLVDVSNIPQSQSTISVDSGVSKQDPTDALNTPQNENFGSNTEMITKHKPSPLKENIDSPNEKKHRSKRRKGPDPLSGGVKLGVSPSTSTESFAHSDS
ncbi:hypothetical protein FB45DRAFT_10469 [Roridomyces roridus]|uniref:Uncharacterized protein n=1 Tax=Roridomyces roridus TaxID=1738132 RepID=A0AAD7G0Y6_9AGAR|nr:hypothetical protein FB45DRAFT_10469 [Roridomyces roridus]